MSFLCNHRCFDRHKEVLAHRMRTMVEIIRAVGDVEELHLCRNLFLGALALVCSTRKWLPAQPRHNPPTSPLAQFQFHACGSVSTRGVLAIRAFLATGNSIWIWSAGLSFLVLASDQSTNDESNHGARRKDNNLDDVVSQPLLLHMNYEWCLLNATQSSRQIHPDCSVTKLRNHIVIKVIMFMSTVQNSFPQCLVLWNILRLASIQSSLLGVPVPVDLLPCVVPLAKK